MTIHAPTPLQGANREASLTASVGAPATSKLSSTAGVGDDPRLKEAAMQFEAVFVRQMLSSLEKATGSPMGNQTSGGSIYGSMVVNSLADAIAHAGGLGLGSMLLKSFGTQGPSTSAAVTGPKLDARDASSVGTSDSVMKAQLASHDTEKDSSPKREDALRDTNIL